MYVKINGSYTAAHTQLKTCEKKPIIFFCLVLDTLSFATKSCKHFSGKSCSESHSLCDGTVLSFLLLLLPSLPFSTSSSSTPFFTITHQSNVKSRTIIIILFQLLMNILHIKFWTTRNIHNNFYKVSFINISSYDFLFSITSFEKFIPWIWQGHILKYQALEIMKQHPL